MKLKWRVAATAAAAGFLVLTGAGCGGVDAQGSVSPLMFLLPGVGQTKPIPTAPGPEVTGTNLVLVARSN